MLKIDVEGSEFLIFRSLAESDVLDRIDAIVMEYHGEPAPLLQILEKYHFRYLVSGRRTIGIISAFKC